MDTPSPFSALHHVCVVVADLDAAEQYYTGVGIGPWQPFPLSGFTDLNIPIEDFQTLSYRYADLGGVQLQLCQPGDADTPQRRFLDERGPGVFHLGFSVPDVDDAEQTGTAAGLDVLLRGRRPGGGFTYFDTAQAGVILQVRSAPPAPSKA